jgi:ELWxxDGT repeat protein
VADRLYFSAFEPTTGRELWTSDGTETGTILVDDINPGSASSFPGELTAVDHTLFFAASEPTTGRQLWAVT